MRTAAACALWLAACDLYLGPAGGHSDGQPACNGPGAPAPIVATGGSGSFAVHVAPSIGTHVLVRDADGTRAVIVDASGDATVAIRPPAIVTAVTTTYVQSITGVEPGDALCLACAPVQAAPVRNAITVPSRSDASVYSFANGEIIQYNAPGPSTTLTAQLSKRHDVLAVVGDASGAVLGWSAAPGLTLVDGEPIALGALQAPVTFTASYDNVPDGASVVIDRAERSSADALPAFAFAKNQGGATLTQQASSWGAPLMVVETELYAGSAAEALYETVPASLAYHVDLGPALLPWMDAPSYDACTHVLSWSEHGGTPGDGVWARIGWDPTTGFIWDVLVPPGTTRIDFDDLTAQLAVPDALTSLYLEGYDIDAVTTYAQMRAWNPAALGPDAVPHRQSAAFASY